MGKGHFSVIAGYQHARLIHHLHLKEFTLRWSLSSSKIPKGFVKKTAPFALPGQCLGRGLAVPLAGKEEPCSLTALPVPLSMASRRSCPAYSGNGNEVHEPPLSWLGRTGTHPDTNCPTAHSTAFPKGHPWALPNISHSEKMHFFIAPAKKRQPRRSAPRCYSTQRHAKLTQGHV